MTKTSPLAPDRFPDMPAVAGVTLAVAASGVKYKGRDDLLVVELAPGTTVAGTFTRSLTAAAPVEWCREIVQGGSARVLVVNTGNANAFTGKVGTKAVADVARAAARLFSCHEDEVFAASTGVIGAPLDPTPILNALPEVRRRLAAPGWLTAANAIKTTDTFPKGSVRTAVIGGAEVTICGIAKGAGMIAPDMATMLGFVFTDAAIPAKVLQDILRPAVERSFNSITVDGDTSTNDTVLLFATGKIDHAPVRAAGDAKLRDFKRKLEEVLVDLARQIIRDGEGASKFVTVSVTGAASPRAARRIAFTIANSPLVKTAIAGQDANWGRIVMAVGKAGEKADRDKLEIRIGGILITAKGGLVPGYDEAPVAAHMKGLEIDIAVDVGIGRGQATVWTCDLTHEYININADYRS
ncbi:bifunctional glutamate N-acetyltransferase/amino-acid acetyltransferase ArgJ [Shumkonia mesophila]|uniref:bifunctional glutamate N-acetyltransferase/amino-acid acetyltransferase ArgJ n=1 Tax=Shumkonia mesophila TaxID=2838854 RepID=UPI002934852A|nr:bifunctional glutamate N-acetyltransferase/amino-acid acetyltransferase ArgJ [Shumkonia mesophila]